jgi:hypothetical protein
MLTHDLQYLPTNKPTRLKNVVCPYCGVGLSKENTTKEHVVGRKFVPKGTLANQWNLILNACRVCNNHKSDLEDDISAITMQPDVSGRPFGTHEQLALDAVHKRARTFSRYTGKVVADSTPTMEIKYQLAPGVTLTFNMTAQAQIGHERAFALALRHFQGFFYFITYNHDANRGWWWKGHYAPIQSVSKTDWGNDVAVAFMDATQTWEHRVLTITADEHFKLAIRKHPTVDIWSLALEWNENYRVLAACGEEAPLREFLAGLPRLQVETVFQTDNSGLQVRTEKVLKQEDDTLFAHSSPPSAPESPADGNT